MAYNHGKAERRWRLWIEKEEKILRECGDSCFIMSITITDVKSGQ